MDFRPDDYFRAGVERMSQARALYKHGDRYALAMYCAGVAVECILRAFIVRRTREFDGRHDLIRLFGASKILDNVEQRVAAKRHSASDKSAAVEVVQELRASMNLVVALWHNNLRYASEQRLRSFLVTLGAHHGIKGDIAKANTVRLLEAAQILVDKGVGLWTSRRA